MSECRLVDHPEVCDAKRNCTPLVIRLRCSHARLSRVQLKTARFSEQLRT